jgi:hypothetical protein
MGKTVVPGSMCMFSMGIYPFFSYRKNLTPVWRHRKRKRFYNVSFKIQNLLYSYGKTIAKRK